MTDFGKWDRFDVDAAEIEVERKAKAEAASRDRVLLETRLLKKCQDRAAQLKSEATVRALKARQARGRRRRRPGQSSPDDLVTTAGSAAEDGRRAAAAREISRAQARASDAAVLAEGLRRGLGLRDKALACVVSGELCTGFNNAREGFAELNVVQALLLRALPPECIDESSVPPTRACCGDGATAEHAGHGRSGVSAEHRVRGEDVACSTHPEGPAEGPADPNTPAEEVDLLRDAMRQLREAKIVCGMAQAECLSRAGRAAEATDALRDLLLESPSVVAAWVQRGKTFVSMRAPLLAGLHFDRALELDASCAEASEMKKELLRSMPTSEPLPDGPSCSLGSDAGHDDAAVDVTATTERGSPGKSRPGTCPGREEPTAPPQKAFRVIVAEACEEFRAGVVLQEEAFFASSREKFCGALLLIDDAERAMEGWEAVDACASEGAGVTAVPGARVRTTLDALRVSCHLNIAAAALERRLEYETVVEHCTRALELQRESTQALLRRAQAHEELGRFRLAMEDLEAAEAIVMADKRSAEQQGNERRGMSLMAELQEVQRRLEHARWTKVHVGNGQDVLPPLAELSGRRERSTQGDASALNDAGPQVHER